VDDARGPAGYSGGEIVLLDKKRAFSAASALSRDGHTVDAASDHHHLKVLAFQPRSWIR
jgi:hypothetical protein